MTRSEVERMTRTASRPSLRFGVRVLVVGGFAGAAWLLSAASAHSAEAHSPAEEAPTDLSVVSLVSGSGNGADERSTLGDTLDTAVAPVAGIATAVTGGTSRTLPDTDQDRPAAHPASAVVLPSAAVSATTPLRTVDTGATGHVDPTTAPPARDAGTGSGGGLLGLTDALVGSSGLLTPVTRVVDPVVAPLDGALRPVSGALLTAARPVTSMLGSVTRIPTGAATAPAQWVPHVPAGGSDPGVAATPVAPGAGAPASRPGATAADGGDTSTTSAQRRPAAVELSAAGTPVKRDGSGNLPDRPYPAPLRGYMGAGAGALASGPGSHAEGGASAVVPSSVVESAVAIHRMRATTDVAALRHEAQAPTVSPD